jgi:hypothetical protein
MLHTYTPYTYLIGWSKLNVWYYGVRTASKAYCVYECGCHPDELWVTYFSSSSYVKDFVLENGKPDVIKIRKTFSDSKSAKSWESKVIRRMKIMHDPKFLNKGNPMGDFIIDESVKKKRNNAIRKALLGKARTDEVKQKISESKKGVIFSDEHRRKLSEWQTGIKRKPCSEETKKKISDKTKGKTRSAETRKKLSDIHTGKEMWPNGRSQEDIDKIKQGWANRELIVCPHCNFSSINASCMKRWHFQNCKKYETN